MNGVFRAFSNLSKFLLGSTNDIPVFEERPYPSIYNRLIYLTKKYPEREDLQAYCQEVKEMIELLREKKKLEAGAFINFCQRIFYEGIDLYEVESMLGEINGSERSVYKDTINRKAFEQTIFFSRLEERLLRLIPDLYVPVRVTSIIEKISKIENSNIHSREFCTELTDLLICLKDNEKLPKEDIELFLIKYVPNSPYYYNMVILLNSPDRQILRVLDGFQRIIFIRHVFEELLRDGMPMHAKLNERNILEQKTELILGESKIQQESLENIRAYLIGNKSSKALEMLISICSSKPDLEKEAIKLQAAYQSLSRQMRLGVISFSKHSKLNWLWTSWALDLFGRLESTLSTPIDSDIQDEGNA